MSTRANGDASPPLRSGPSGDKRGPRRQVLSFKGNKLVKKAFFNGQLRPNNGEQLDKPSKGDFMSETQSQIEQPLFALGRLVATPGALELLTRSEQTPLEFLARHSRGDWGECCPEDAIENDFSVKAGFRIFSVYRTRNGEKLWVITEADRSVTTLLLPSEY